MTLTPPVGAAKPFQPPEDPHAHECYTCEFGHLPPAGTKACRGCISKDSRPHWVPKAEYAEAALAAIAKATGSPK